MPTGCSRRIGWAVIAFATVACSEHSTTAPTRSVSVTCSLTEQGSQVAFDTLSVSWRYNFTGVTSASFTSTILPASNNRQLTTSPGFVTSMRPFPSIGGAVTLTAGSCVQTREF